MPSKFDGYDLKHHIGIIMIFVSVSPGEVRSQSRIACLDQPSWHHKYAVGDPMGLVTVVYD